MRPGLAGSHKGKDCGTKSREKSKGEREGIVPVSMLSECWLMIRCGGRG